MDTLSLIPLLERANQIASISDLDDLLEQTLALLVEVCAARAGALYLLDETARTLVFKAGDSRPFGAHPALARSLAGKALRQRQPFHQEGLTGRRFHGLLSLPLLSGGQPVGVIHLFDVTQPATEL